MSDRARQLDPVRLAVVHLMAVLVQERDYDADELRGLVDEAVEEAR